MIIQSRYLKFQIPYSKIYERLNAGNYKNIIFHIDLPSISRGFYNREVIEYEIADYIETQKMPTYFLLEAQQFLSNLYIKFKQYNPKFNIFYDNGNCGQNNALYSGYKDRSRDRSKVILEDLDMELFSNIKNYYYEQFEPLFTIPGSSKVTFLKEYEADFVPWILLRYNIWNCQDPSTLNIILSVDKDLLQCCQYENTYQVTNRFIFNDNKTRKILQTEIWNDINAIQYVYPKFKVGLLTSKYIPLILSIKGDDSDGIAGIPKFGYSKTVQLISDYNLPSELNELLQSKTLPLVIKQNIKKIEQNYKMISFKEQLKPSVFILVQISSA